eukprot:1382167-Rhodomonas_salina.2
MGKSDVDSTRWPHHASRTLPHTSEYTKPLSLPDEYPDRGFVCLSSRVLRALPIRYAASLSAASAQSGTRPRKPGTDDANIGSPATDFGVHLPQARP